MKTISGHNVCLSFSQPSERLSIWIDDKSYTLFGFCDFFARQAKLGHFEDPEWANFNPYERIDVYGGFLGLSYLGYVQLNLAPVKPGCSIEYLEHLVNLANRILRAPLYKPHTSFICE